MKIAIDAFPVMLQKTGIGYYTNHLITQFVAVAPENEYYLCDVFLASRLLNVVRLGTDLSKARAFFRISDVPFPFVTLARLFLCMRNKLSSGSARLEDADIFFGTNFRGIFRENMKTVITIHDMAHIYFPEKAEKKSLSYLTNELPRAVEKACLLIADSECTKNDVMRYLKVPEKKVRVVYCGLDHSVFNPVKDPAVLSAVRTRYRLPEEFILFLGTIEPRKNLEGLLRAYAALSGKKTIRHHLVIAGGAGWKNQKLKKTIEDLALGSRVHFTGYVGDKDLPALYSLSSAFVFPSFYEGFGLPVLEAMACGVPVVASNNSSIPEVAGDAAVLIDPSSTESIADGLESVLTDYGLRESLIGKGIERAKLFTWEKSAREILAVFGEALGSR